jgi:serine/threonine protein kinase/Tfp pilus assembly protein PilF
MGGETDKPQEASGAPGNSPDVPATLRRESHPTAELATDGTDGDLPRLAPGEQLAGRFNVLRFIARGGMGAVYEANDVILRTPVALKVLQGRIVSDAAVMERFRREVLLARRVSHPNVCRVYELYQGATADGTPIHFLTMEFLEGETLAARIARTGRMTTAEALPLVQQMCDGLAAAHAEGIIHRDFKSSNVMLVQRSATSRQTLEGTRVAITDFGIARALVQDGAAGGNALTGEAGVIGTPEYMAPEQVTGGDISEATDVYALGIVLYEMVTGQLPFSANTPLATAARRLNEPPPRPELAVPGLDVRWSRTILRCLDRDPRRRFQKASEVAAALSGGTPQRLRSLAFLGAALLLLLLAGAGVLLGKRSSHENAQKAVAAAAVPPSIAVLPFVDMSPQHDQGYFSDGVAQEIINALAQVPGLHVAARSSSFSFKGTNEDLRTVAQKLDVAHVLEGSVRKAGNRLRVTAQLVNAADGYQLWSHSFDSELADVFAVQDQIASAVVAALKANVLPNSDSASAGGGRKVTTPEAYAHYLHGVQLYNTGSVPGLREAIEEFEKAIAADPDYPPAHAGLSLAAFLYANSINDEFDAREWTRRALTEADRAVELDPNDVDAHVARGLLRAGVSWDWPGAHEDFERAVALAPGAANAHNTRAMLMAAQGQLPAAIEEAKKAVELDPLSPVVIWDLASFYNAVGQYALARQLLRKGLETAPEHGLVTRELGFTELLDGHPSEALAIFKGHPQEWIRKFGTALAEHSLGNEAASKTALERLESSSGKTAAYQVAEAHAWRGEPDAAFEWLEQARERRDPGIRYVKYDPLLRSLRTDARYAALLKTLKLPPG